MKQAERHIREPLFHIAKRDALVWWAAWLIRIAQDMEPAPEPCDAALRISGRYSGV